MAPRLSRIALSAAVLVLLGEPAPATADLIRLKNGGELRGRVDRTPDALDREAVTIETLTGARVTVERRHIEFVTPRSLAVEEYETRARRCPDTPEAHWELAEWCRENALRPQRETHLRRIVEILPDHEAAHRGLGHVEYEGQWMSRDDMMQAQGYVRHKGRYITLQELEIIEKTQAELDAEREWFPKVRLWTGWLTGRNEQRRQLGLAELQAIADPNAVPALVRNLKDDANLQVRNLYVGILSNLSSERAVPPLVSQSLWDTEAEVRYNALHGIDASLHPVAAPLYLRELRHEYNVIVRRAAVALQSVADEAAVPQLIEALTTTHTYQVRVPDASGTVSFWTDPGPVTGGRSALPTEFQSLLNNIQHPYGAVINFPAGAVPPRRTRIVKVRHEHQNQEVLTALQRLTGESFGFEKRTWRLWLAAERQGTAKVN